MENKKLVILFTDGKPEGSRDDKLLEEETKQEIINMKNKKIDFFTIFYVNEAYFNYQHKRYVKHGIYDMYVIKDTIDFMRSIFKSAMYETSDFKEVEKIMIKKLCEAVEKINQGA